MTKGRELITAGAIIILSLLLAACQPPEEVVEVPDTGQAEPTQEAAGESEAEEPEVEPPTEEPEPTATEMPRTAVIESMTGSVEVNTEGSFVPAAEGLLLAAGDEIRTGEDGQATLVLDDGTLIVVAPNSAFAVSALEGTADTPITRFFLNAGDLFTVHEGDLAPDAVYEVETPEGVAAIRGSSLRVTFDPLTGSGVAECLKGTCSFTIDGTEFALTGGEKFIFPGGGVEPMSVEDFLAWIAVLQELGVEVEVPPFCGDGAVNQESEACDGADTGTCPAGCTASCTCEFFCGDGICGGPEDASNCPADCPATCGDGVVSHDEACEARSDCGLEVFWKCNKQCQCEQLPDEPEGGGDDKKKKKKKPIPQ